MTKQAYHISNDELISELERFLDITDQDRILLAKIQPLLTAQTANLEKAFYTKIRSEPTIAEFLAGSDIESRQVVSAWFNDLLSGKYDRDYFNKRCKIGITHVRIGLPIRYPIAMMEVVRRYSSDVLQQNLPPEEVLAAQSLINRLLGLDLAIFNHAYEDSMFQRLDLSAGISRELFYSLMRSAS
jgi:Protoglobin